MRIFLFTAAITIVVGYHFVECSPMKGKTVEEQQQSRGRPSRSPDSKINAPKPHNPLDPPELFKPKPSRTNSLVGVLRDISPSKKSFTRRDSSNSPIQSRRPSLAVNTFKLLSGHMVKETNFITTPMNFMGFKKKADKLQAMAQNVAVDEKNYVGRVNGVSNKIDIIDEKLSAMVSVIYDRLDAFQTHSENILQSIITELNERLGRETIQIQKLVRIDEENKKLAENVEKILEKCRKITLEGDYLNLFNKLLIVDGQDHDLVLLDYVWNNIGKPAENLGNNIVSLINKCEKEFDWMSTIRRSIKSNLKSALETAKMLRTMEGDRDELFKMIDMVLDNTICVYVPEEMNKKLGYKAESLNQYIDKVDKTVDKISDLVKDFVKKIPSEVLEIINSWQPGSEERKMPPNRSLLPMKAIMSKKTGDKNNGQQPSQTAAPPSGSASGSTGTGTGTVAPKTKVTGAPATSSQDEQK